MNNFPLYYQTSAMDCGPTCLKMIGKYYGNFFDIESLRKNSNLTKLGVNIRGVINAATFINFDSLCLQFTCEQLKEQCPFPCILHWEQRHFVVLYKIKNNNYFIADPEIGKQVYKESEFKKHFYSSLGKGIALCLEPNELFYKTENTTRELSFRNNIKSLFFYFSRYRKSFIQLFLGVFLAGILLTILPFLTQSIIDKGIVHNDLNLIYILLIAQLIVICGSAIIEYVRNTIMLYTGSKINISLVSYFLDRLLKLPISFFEIHLRGDILQRVDDHKTVESMLTEKFVNMVFAALTVILFSLLMIYYNPFLFLLLIIGSVMSVCWIFLFLNKRKFLELKIFDLRSRIQNKQLELIEFVNEIKISNSVREKRWEWEELQAGLFKQRLKALRLNQKQHNGARIINRIFSILIVFYASLLVLSNGLTIGELFAISLIIGQINLPISQLIEIVPFLQDTSLALRRISEVKNLKTEDELDENTLNFSSGGIALQNVSFSYSGLEKDNILKNINLLIPEGKTTAIVGSSGSGKTTLLKLLVKFYSPTQGFLRFNGIEINKINTAVLRDKCGVVFQDGGIFSDTIAKNIAMNLEIDIEKLQYFAKLASIDTFIESLPNHYFTTIGKNGLGLSSGQMQRIQLARALYKDPDYLFLDEATSALDALNEKSVMENIYNSCTSKTIIIIAHRLSTVKRADQIITINDGEIVEVGNHEDLTKVKGIYYNLIKEQLELGI